MILQKTKFPGVYFRESDEKKYNGKPDRCFYIKFYKHKKQVQKVVGWLSAGVNAQYAAQMRVDFLDNKIKDKEVITFGKAFDIYIEWAKVNKKTWKDDLRRYNYQVKSFFENRFLNEITVSDINNFVIYLKKYTKKNGKKYAPQSILHYLHVIRRVFSFSIDNDIYMESNPANLSKVKLERFDNSRIAYLTDDEMARFLSVCNNPKLVEFEDGSFFKFAFYTGLRRSEIFNLDWSNVDIDKGIIFLKETKGKKNETIILLDSALNILKKIGKKDGYVFSSTKTGGKRNDVSKKWAKIKKLANIRPEIRFHDLRHNFGTMAVTAGVPIDVLQKIMTHKNIETTQRYAHIMDKRLHDAANVMNNAFNSIDVLAPAFPAEVKSAAKK